MTEQELNAVLASLDVEPVLLDVAEDVNAGFNVRKTGKKNGKTRRT